MLTQPVTCPVCGREVPATLGVVGVHDRKDQIPGRSECWWLCPGTGRKVALARDPRDTASPTCIAYISGGGKDGRICGAPAPILDPVRGGMVCRLHQPDLPSYLDVDDGILCFDVPGFIRESGLTDTPATREDVTHIAAAVLRDWWPGIPVEIR